MPININGQSLPDGAPFIVDGVQVEEVVCNGVLVWRNNILPSAITDFAASTNQENQVTVTFSLATGLPNPTYDLYREGSLVASDIASGHIYAIPGPDTSNYFVRAVNAAGSTDSNTDSGVSIKPFDNILDTVVNDAVGTLMSNHIMDSGHRWFDLSTENPSTVQVFGNSSNGRSIKGTVPAGDAGSAVSGLVITTDPLPPNFQVVTRFDWTAGGLGTFLATVGQDTDTAVSIILVDKKVSTDPSLGRITLNGVAQQEFNVIDSLDTPNYVIITINVTGNSVNGSININGTVYNTNTVTATWATIYEILAYGTHAVLPSLPGDCALSEFSLTKT